MKHQTVYTAKHFFSIVNAITTTKTLNLLLLINEYEYECASMRECFVCLDATDRKLLVICKYMVSMVFNLQVWVLEKYRLYVINNFLA